MRGRRAAALASAAMWLCGGGCREVVVACAADGTCPAGRSCVEGICRPTEADATGGTGSDGGLGAEGGCLAPAGPAARSAAAGGVATGELIVLHGDGSESTPCTHEGVISAGAWGLKDCAGWRALAGGQPSPREGAASAGWPEKRTLFMYGGRVRTGSSGQWTPLSGLWRYAAAQGAWKKLSGGGPPGRSRAGLGIRPATGELVLFGGDAGASDLAPVPLADVWRRAPGAGWKRLYPAPGPTRRFGHAAAVSGDGRFLLVFGGLSKAGEAAAPLGDTWRLDIEAEKWLQLSTPAGAPTPRHGARLLRVPGDPRLLLFGGRDGGQVGVRNDLWLLDPATGLWQLARPGDLGAGGLYGAPLTPAKDACTRPAGFTAVDPTSPPRRFDHLWGWNPLTHEVWLFGGRGDCGPLADVWTLGLQDLRWRALTDDEAGWSCARRGLSCEGLCPQG